MSKQLIISIGREFGSGGHEIAKKLSEHYGLDMLDHNLLDEIAAERNVDAEALKEWDEKHKKPVVTRTVKGMSSSHAHNVQLMQFDYMKKKAANGDSFVIVGRCSEEILKGTEGLVSIFVLGDRECKVERIMKLYNMDKKQAEDFIDEKDYKRKKYHNGFCKIKWGDSRNYDLSINSSRLGVDGTVKMLIDYIDKRRQG